MTDERSDSVKKALELFMRNDRMHRRLFEKNVVQRLGIHRSQHMMLMSISCFGSCSQKDIAARLDISPAAAAVTRRQSRRPVSGSDGFLMPAGKTAVKM